MKYFIYAAENMYQGLYGMEDYCFIDTDDYDIAVCEAEGLSMSVIENYFMEELEDTAAEMYERDSKEYNEYLDELIRENIYFIIYVLQDEYEDMTEKEVHDKVNQLGIAEFIETYCEDA